MYVQGFIIPVPADKQDAYREVAEKFWPIAHDNGAIEHVEAWEADVADGKQPTGLGDPYGLCMYRSSRDGATYVFINGDSLFLMVCVRSPPTSTACIRAPASTSSRKEAGLTNSVMVVAVSGRTQSKSS